MTAAEQIDSLLDVMLDLEVELGRRVMQVREVIELEEGSVIRLIRSAGENIDIIVGGALVGFGELVIMEDTIGVRITDFNIEE